MEHKIKAVVFDMDGVLFDTERLCSESLREVGAKQGMEPKKLDKVIEGCIGLNQTDTRLWFLENYGENFPFEDFCQSSSRWRNEKMDREGLPVKVGAKELLEYLKAEGYQIALASSTRRPRVLEHLEQAGFTDYFAEVVGGDMVEHSKPQPDIYLLACSKIGVAPGDAIAIEDSPNGIRSAYRAGMQVIMVPDQIAPTPEIEQLLFRRCDDLLQVKSFLQNGR